MISGFRLHLHPSELHLVRSLLQLTRQKIIFPLSTLHLTTMAVCFRGKPSFDVGFEGAKKILKRPSEAQMLSKYLYTPCDILWSQGEGNKTSKP